MSTIKQCPKHRGLVFTTYECPMCLLDKKGSCGRYGCHHCTDRPIKDSTIPTPPPAPAPTIDIDDGYVSDELVAEVEALLAERDA